MAANQLGVNRAKRLSEADTDRRPRTVSKLPDRETYSISLPADCVRSMGTEQLQPKFHDGYGPLVIDVPAIVFFSPEMGNR